MSNSSKEVWVLLPQMKEVSGSWRTQERPAEFQNSPIGNIRLSCGLITAPPAPGASIQSWNKEKEINMAHDSVDYEDEYYEELLRSENSTSYNFTNIHFGQNGLPTTFAGISIGLYCIIFLVGVPGNAAVIWIIGFKVKRTAGNIWFLNLSIADLLCCLALPFVITNHAMDRHWPFGTFACKVIPSLILLNASASVLILAMISIDRCILVMWPVWCQNKRTLPKASAACVAVWSLALLLTSPSFIFRRLYSEGYTRKTTCNLKYSIAGVHEQFFERFISVFRFVMAFLIPFLFITICNGLILAKVRRSWHNRSNRTLKVILVVIVAFFFCWFPHQVLALILALNTQDSSLYIRAYGMHSFATGMAYVNSCINPVIYVLMGHNFKDQFRKSLRKGLIRILADDYSQMGASDAKVKVKAPSQLEKSTGSSAL
ncbi:C5a anaphylatoxin chemotactic receptor 1-like [Ambystoma mexicanum]|uniref:C5a anaphylatoxin chemotactic receptor 1-like n=1 Tax=Ambystoma mexicanum TaxID=8296 RepID=UPI0037E920D5